MSSARWGSRHFDGFLLEYDVSFSKRDSCSSSQRNSRVFFGVIDSFPSPRLDEKGHTCAISTSQNNVTKLLQSVFRERAFLVLLQNISLVKLFQEQHLYFSMSLEVNSLYLSSSIAYALKRLAMISLPHRMRCIEIR